MYRITEPITKQKTRFGSTLPYRGVPNTEFCHRIKEQTPLPDQVCNGILAKRLYKHQ